MIRVVPPGSGSWFFAHPGSRSQKGTGSRIRISNTGPNALLLSRLPRARRRKRRRRRPLRRTARAAKELPSREREREDDLPPPLLSQYYENLDPWKIHLTVSLSSLTSYLSFLFKLCFKSWLDLCILLIHDLVLCNLWTFKIKVFVPNIWVCVFSLEWS
jgi:hypothetical protein